MRLLELFSGARSVGIVAEDLGYEVTSLDLKGADININILDWNYKEYAVGYFDVIWSSPPCTEYSIAKTIGVRDIEGANKIVEKTLEIIRYFQPKKWMIENPQTGLLKYQSFMIFLPYHDVDYCKYGKPYRKRTRIWNNLINWKPKPLCKRDCDNMLTKTRHIATAQRGLRNGKYKQYNSLNTLHSIPSALIYEILSAETHLKT